MKRKAVILGLYINGVTILRNLTRQGYEVWGVTENSRDKGLHSRYGKELICPNPESECKKWVSFMQHLGRNIKDRPVLIPTSDRYVLALTRVAKELKNYFRFHGYDTDLSEKLTLKHTQLELANLCQFPTPHWRLITGRKDLISFVKKVKGKILIKPDVSHHWQIESAQQIKGEAKVMVASNRDELLKIYELVKPFSKNLILMEYIPGPDKNLFYWTGFVRKDGKVAGRLVGQKTRVHPIHFGSASFVELVDNKKVENLCNLFLKKLGYAGLCGIEVKLDPRDNQYKLIEINPRYGLWEDIGIPEGVDLAKQAVDSLYGDVVSIKRPRSFTQKWVSLHRDIRVFPKYWKEGELNPFSWLWSLRPPIIINDLPLSDLKFVIGMVKLQLSRLIKKVRSRLN